MRLVSATDIRRILKLRTAASLRCHTRAPEPDCPNWTRTRLISFRRIRTRGAAGFEGRQAKVFFHSSPANPAWKAVGNRGSYGRTLPRERTSCKHGSKITQWARMVRYYVANLPLGASDFTAASEQEATKRRWRQAESPIYGLTSKLLPQVGPSQRGPSDVQTKWSMNICRAFICGSHAW